MVLRGSYLNEQDSEISVEIEIYDNTQEEVEIGVSGLTFCPTEAITLTGQTNDVFDVCQRQSGCIRLQTDRYLGFLFSPDVTRSLVVIKEDGATVYTGRILPQAYNQPFNETIDEIGINLIDHISSLDYMPWRILMGPSTSPITLRYLLTAPFEKMHTGLDVEIDETEIYQQYDMLSMLDATINPGIFMDTERTDDDVSVLSALESALRYLGLCVTQHGDKLVYYRPERQTYGEPIEISTDIVSGTDTQIEVPEMYNRVSVEVDCDEKEMFIESPLDSDNIKSDYPNLIKYESELSLLDSLIGPKKWNAFRLFLLGYEYPVTACEGLWYREWWIRVMNHAGWKFYGLSGTYWGGDLSGHGPDYYTYIKTGGAGAIPDTPLKEQCTIADYLGDKMGAALIKTGTMRIDFSPEEYKIPSRLEEKDNLVIGLPRVTYIGDPQPGLEITRAWQAQMWKSVPRAIYQGTTEGISLSPEDDETIRYLIIKGRIGLCPNQKNDKKWSTAAGVAADYDVEKAPQLLAYYTNYQGGDNPRYYLTKTVDGSEIKLDFLYEGESQEWFNLSSRQKEKWDMPGGRTLYIGVDMIKKIPIISCMLVVGDKCLVERKITGENESLEWRTFKEYDDCADFQEYVAQSFTVGIDPKNGDPLVGKWYDIGNTINYTMGLEEEGMAIPIRKSDNVSGTVRFVILGPVDLVMGNDRNPLYINKDSLLSPHYGVYDESMVSDVRHVLQYCTGIWLQDFEIKITSDNGGVAPLQEGKLVYVSDTATHYRHEREPEHFRIGSALTKEERDEIGVRDKVRDNTVIGSDGKGITSVYDPVLEVTGKPERIYVDHYYRECNRPVVELYQTLRSEVENAMFRSYRHPALGNKEFRVLSIDRDLMEGTIRLRLREKL